MDTLDRRHDTPRNALTHAPRNASPTDCEPVIRLAYLLSQYPAISHTFFLNEVLGLRARGVAVETASINRPDRPVDQLSTREAAEARRTRYIKSGNAARNLLRVATIAFRNPAALLRGLAGVARVPALTLRERGYWMFYLAEALLVGDWMRQSDLHHLHVHFGGPVASVGMLTGTAWRLPYSLTIHGPEELLNVDGYHLHAKVAGAAFCFCISDFCRSQLQAILSPQQWSKLHVVRLGVDPMRLVPATRGPRAHGPLQLVCTGRLVAAKGQHVLLSALHELAGRGIYVRATFIGGGADLSTLTAFVAQHGMEDQVTFTGALSHADTLRHVRSADIFALPSFAEGIPVALMESMALGVPCVSTTVAGIPELIAHERDGLLVSPGNVSALADALSALATDPALRRRLATAARERIISEYNLPLNHELLAHQFATLVSTPGSHSR